jgi:hypothetical protein
VLIAKLAAIDCLGIRYPSRSVSGSSPRATQNNQIMRQPSLPTTSWQFFIISVWHSDIDLSERKHVAICS